GSSGRRAGGGRRGLRADGGPPPNEHRRGRRQGRSEADRQGATARGNRPVGPNRIVRSPPGFASGGDAEEMVRCNGCPDGGCPVWVSCVGVRSLFENSTVCFL